MPGVHETQHTTCARPSALTHCSHDPSASVHCLGHCSLTLFMDTVHSKKKRPPSFGASQNRGVHNHGQKNRRFRQIFRRKIGFRWCWKRYWDGKIGKKKKIGEKSPIFLIKTDFSPKKPIFPGKFLFLIFFLTPKICKKLLLTGFEPTQNA